MAWNSPLTAPAHRLALAGISAIGVTFGFARYGYGLFLPELREECGLSVSLVGLLGSATYVGYAAVYVAPPLTTVRRPFDAVARERLRLLARAIETPDAVPARAVLWSHGCARRPYAHQLRPAGHAAAGGGERAPERRAGQAAGA